MWSFRKKNSSVLPDEVQDYYNQTKGQRTWVAWALAIATMLVTIALALALFYGGRWIYRQLFNNNDSNTTQKAGEQQPTKQNGSGSTDQPATSGTSSTNTQQSQPTTTNTTPTTQPSTPRTGPDEDL